MDRRAGPRHWHSRFVVGLARAGRLRQDFSVPELGYRIFDGGRGLLLHYFRISCYWHAAFHVRRCGHHVMASIIRISAGTYLVLSDEWRNLRAMARAVLERWNQSRIAGHPVDDDRAGVDTVGSLSAIGNTVLNESVRIGGLI